MTANDNERQPLPTPSEQEQQQGERKRELDRAATEHALGYGQFLRSLLD